MYVILPEERIQQVLKAVNETKVIAIEELCNRLKVSKATIRRDLKELEKRNKLIRTHGGALSKIDEIAYEPPFTVKRMWHIEEKKRIVEAASKYIKPGETIILDSGTTMFELAKKILTMKNITVITNDIINAMELSQNKDIDLIVVGGKLRKDFYTLTGIFAETILKSIHVDKYFIGADAVDIKFGLMNYNIEEIPIKKLMLAASKERYALCDHSKFESVAFTNICSFESIDKVITGSEINPKIVESFTNAGVNFQIV